jgi:hypothetical protein
MGRSGGIGVIFVPVLAAIPGMVRSGVRHGVLLSDYGTASEPDLWGLLWRIEDQAGDHLVRDGPLKLPEIRSPASVPRNPAHSG